MEKVKDIDDIFSNALTDFGVQPPENLQEAIAKNRNNNGPEEGGNNKKYILIFITAIVVLVASLFFTYNEEQSIVDAKQKVKSKNESSKNTTAFNNSESTIELKGTNKNLSTKQLNQANISKNNTTIVETVVEEYVKPMVSQETSKSSFIFKGKAIHRKKEAIFINQNQGQIHQTLMQNEIENDEKILKNVVTEKKSLSNEIENPNNKLNTKSNDEIIVNNKLDTVQILPLKADTNNVFATTKNQSELIDTAKLIKKLSWYIEPAIGVNAGQNRFATSNTISINQLKDSIKMTQPIYNYGVNVGVQKNRLSIKLGIGIQHWKEQLGYSYTTQKYITGVGDSIIIKGTDTVVKHNIPITVLSTVSIANNNKTSYTYLQIPLFISYTMPIKKVDVAIGFGIIFNQLLKSKGNYKDFTSGKLIDYTSKNDSQLRSNYISSQLSIGVAYNISSNMKLCFYVPCNVGFKSIYNSDYAIIRKVNSIGLQVGLKIKL